MPAPIHNVTSIEMRKPPRTFRQPYKGLYLISQAASLIFLIPAWTFFYLVRPKPRDSWTLRESIDVKLVRKLVLIHSRCGMDTLANDKNLEVPQSKLKETTFHWLEPAYCMVRREADDVNIFPIHVPAYLWPKNADVMEDDGLFGIFFHGGGWGGGYTMGNASETFSDSNVPRKLCKRSRIHKIISVDYRLTSESSHPAQLLDALAAYTHVIHHWHVDPSRIVLIGTCGGGHLALMLMRYLHCERVMPFPAALILFSPWIDMALDQTLYLVPGKERPNADIDVVVTSYLENIRFLGNYPTTHLTSPYLSANLAPPGSYKHYPCTFISVGKCETFHKEARQLVELLRNDGVDVTVSEQEDAVHNFMARTRVPVPSRKAKKRVLEDVRTWIDGVARVEEECRQKRVMETRVEESDPGNHCHYEHSTL